MPAPNVELAEIDLPEFGLPDVEPVIPAETYQARLAEARRRTAQAGYDALLVYGDREHFANLAYLTRYDPRFEEALLIVVPGRDPTLLVGNEGMAYSYYSPLTLQRVLYQPFSLISQPRNSSQPLATIFEEAGLRRGMTVGFAGWKYFTEIEADDPRRWLEVPHYLVEQLHNTGCTVYNAAALFMEPEYGMRAVNEVDQLAYFEYSASWGSQGIRNALFGVRPDMTEAQVMQLTAQIGLPLSYHPVMMSGERNAIGLASPSTRRLQVGDPVFVACGPWGSNTARGGFLVEDESALPEPIRDYVDKLIVPYFRAVAEWYEHIGIGVSGGELYDIIHKHLGDPFFGVTLNPGHLIHLDEWVSSPIDRGSTQRLRSGMAIQVDVIPSTGTPYHTTNIEDTIALAGESLRNEFADKYPGAWERVQKRRAFMQDSLGIQLKPEVLPFSNIPAYLPPFWLAPRKVMRAKQ
jgi:hypothetical protein